MSVLGFPTRRDAFARTVRLVSSARLRAPVLARLVAPDQLADVAEIEGATSTRLLSARTGADGIGRDEFVAGLPHAHFINAAFAYARPAALNRFNGPGRGAWYAAFSTETCIAEVSFHMTRELTAVAEFHATVEYAEMFASMAGSFVDLRDAIPQPDCLDPDPARGYPAGNALADATRAAGHNGIIWPSVRDRQGTCIVALWPSVVQSVAQGRVLRLVWNGGPAPAVEAAG